MNPPETPTPGARRKIGVLPFARATFDVAFAREKSRAMFAQLERAAARGNFDIIGAREMLFDQAAAMRALRALPAVDQLLVLQLTFTDADAVVAAAAEFAGPLGIWAAPEPRIGGRLRLNAFCGLNLASHALGLHGRDFSYLYADPAALTVAGDLDELLDGRRMAGRLDAAPVDPTAAASTDAAQPMAVAGRAIARALAGKRIARIGAHPPGFHTCAYSAARVEQLTGVTIDEFDIDELFDAARAASAASVADARRIADDALHGNGMDALDQPQLNRSLRLKAGLDALRARGGYDAFAVRCWPETFTEYGGAVCAPVSMLGEAKIPCACEADVYGALTQMLVQEAADAPVFLSDLVDLDAADDSGVIWHCGQAPISMRDPDPKPGAAPVATIHTNRKMPLLYQFALKPGAMTFARISQSRNQPKFVIGACEALQRPLAFTGTSGVVRFARGASQVLRDLIDARIEHHMVFVYGDHRAKLRAAAAALGLPALEL